jgi:hypothetical protein
VKGTISPSDKALIAFVKTIAPELVASWEAELRAKVERYRDWGIANFDIIDYSHDVRIKVRNYRVVAVRPRKPQPDGGQ